MSPDQISQIIAKPISINELQLRNRIIMGPMAVNAPSPEGAATEQTAAFLAARARGGVGMIIVGGAIASQRGFEESPFKPLLRFDRDEHIESFHLVAQAVHAHETPLIAEIMPSFGRMGVPAPGRPILSASPKNVVIPRNRFPRGMHVPMDRRTEMPQEASVKEIKYFESEMVAAALRVQAAGWDGVEVAAHMSYFASSFLSPRTNWRTDEYGGSLTNRARMLCDMVHGIRSKTGPRFVIGLRITSNDFLPDGCGVEEYAEIARLVEARGLDYVALSSGCYEAMDASATAEDAVPGPGCDADVFKRKLRVPVLVGGLHDPERAARAIAEGHGDLIMLARPLLADPNFARKIAERRPETIVACVRDNLCMRRMIFGMPVRCEVNSQMGRESRPPGALPPAARFVKAPVEKVVLGITGSEQLMNLLGKLTKGKVDAHPDKEGATHS